MNIEETPVEDESSGSTIPAVGRRTLMGWFWKVVGALALIEMGWITSSVLRSARQSKKDLGERLVDVGMIEEFGPGTVTPVPQGQFHLACLSDGSFLALSKSCTHLGCSVPWDEEQKKFICPCHGSTFDLHGSVLTPPALRPLDYFPVLIENGLVRVDISKPMRRDAFIPTQTSRV
ncbi:MAG: cytochrome b6-f complex iron-sulfur subunit [Desulforhopalus sp.]|jgi:cytochrome b6-f complex iron-sulfur subunit